MNIQIIGYLVAVVVIHLLLGNTATYWFVLLVFFGVLMSNIDEIANVFNGSVKLKNKIAGG